MLTRQRQQEINQHLVVCESDYVYCYRTYIYWSNTLPTLLVLLVTVTLFLEAVCHFGEGVTICLVKGMDKKYFLKDTYLHPFQV